MRRPGPVLALALCACSGTEITVAEPEEPNLSVVGYVTIDLDPAYGVVFLFDATERALASQVITAGRYGISLPVEAGTDVCGGYAVRAFVRDEFGPREDTIRLSAESGPCTMPGDASIEHWITFDLPYRQGTGNMSR